MASAYSQQIGFAAGILVATQVNDIVPIRFGILQDASMEYRPETKKLFGQNRYAFALAQGKTEVTIKAKFAGIRGLLYNKLLFGGTVTSGSETLFVDSESHAYATSVAVTNAGTFRADEGVVDATSGNPLLAVASSPAVNQYSVSAGTYTFNAGQPAGNVLISYTYTAAQGQRTAFGNPQMGSQPFFSVVLNQPYDGRQQTWEFNRCVADRFTVPTRLDDFIINEFDMIASADPSGNLGYCSTDIS